MQIFLIFCTFYIDVRFDGNLWIVFISFMIANIKARIYDRGICNLQNRTMLVTVCRLGNNF